MIVLSQAQATGVEVLVSGTLQARLHGRGYGSSTICEERVSVRWSLHPSLHKVLRLE